VVHECRVNTSEDVLGVELAGALKNVLAIAAGVVSFRRGSAHRPL